MRQLCFVLVLLLSYGHSSAVIIRVNSNPASTAPFHDLQQAIDFAAPNDIIYFEGELNTYGNSPEFPICTNVTLNKPLHLVGPGYFLGSNNIYNYPYNASCIQNFMIFPGAAGSWIEGMSIGIVQFQANNVTMSRNRICQLQINSGASNTFSQNYMQPVCPGFPVIGINSGNNNLFATNFIAGSSLSNISEPLIMDIGGFGNIYLNNTIVGGQSFGQFSQFSNNIFGNHTFVNIDFCTFDFNIFSNDDFLQANDPGGNFNDPFPILSNPTNLLGIEISSLFTGSGTSTTDAGWQLTAGSLASGYGNDGGNAGMFTNTEMSYRLSGLPDIPIIQSLIVSECATQTFPLSVSMEVSSPNDLPIVFAEYFFDVDPGIGFTPLITITPDPAGFVLLPIDVSFLTPGTHILGIRVVDVNLQFSFTHESTFEVKVLGGDLPNLAGIEYFAGIDPGYGGGTFLANSVDAPDGLFNTIISLLNLTPGPHTLSYRALDDSGDYGITLVKTILVTQDAGGTDDLLVENLEFFINDDPGFDAGASIPQFGDDGTAISYTVFFPTPGIHELSTRVKDNLGNWSVAQVRTVYILPDDQAAPDLQSLEYYFDIDPGYDNATQVVIPGGIDAQIIFTADMSGVDNLGWHRLFTRVKDVSGDYSTTYRKWIYLASDGFLIADIDNNGVVNVADLLLIMAAMGCNGFGCVGDMTQDGTITTADLLLFLSYYGIPGAEPPSDFDIVD